jgi:hypothetical protein
MIEHRAFHLRRVNRTTRHEMRRGGERTPGRALVDAIRLVTYVNALAVYGQSGQMSDADWTSGAAVD